MDLSNRGENPKPRRPYAKRERGGDRSGDQYWVEGDQGRSTLRRGEQVGKARARHSVCHKHENVRPICFSMVARIAESLMCRI
jgi:hypothetical protein